MDWLFYLFLTAIFYVYRLVSLKSRTEQERIGSTPVFFSTLGFFAIFEFVFADSLFRLPLFHILGLIFSFVYAFTIYIYLRNLKKEVEVIFEKLVKQSQGKVSVLTFMQRTNMTKDEAMDYLDGKLRQLPGITYETLGNIYYEFDRW
ncbi:MULTISPECIES: hypothetical protein [Synechocystis]|uniref:Uncharacterized protein n=1 Tax=Synechocystis salina LEGE 00031 TaxID=1828736 RepID=A0ABR9VMI2_9SYNC|nr:MULTISPECIES: hypothetical protein [Synechocystis]MBD2653841.1 hypothetical protein [Synechocystis sp. FACHB-383]MBE9195289.1 hypothetical protein [Synechocystis sp. LEGE 06083]MBE9240035.1 hypothetical protein [Synechocystis salina LEGE 00041]MBE9252545.1 hypothetical protein [Synechocystis salina LEGE 00031]